MILGYLSVEELYEFIQSPDYKEYQDSATEAYGLTYGNIVIFARGYKVNGDFTNLGYMINFHDFTTFTKFPAAFNKYVKNIRIDFSRFNRLSNEIDHYLSVIQFYSSKTLNRIEIRRATQLDLRYLQTISFPNVGELSFFRSKFKDQILDLKRAFPQM